MGLDISKLQALLVKPGHISQKDFDEVQMYAKRSGQPFEKVLVEKDLIKDNQLGQIIAEDLGFRYVSFGTEKVDESAMLQIPEAISRARKVMAFAMTDNEIKVGLSSPDDLEILHYLEKVTGKKVIPYYATEKDISEHLYLYQASISDEFNSILENLNDASVPAEKKDAIVVRMVDVMLQYAYYNKASDIHVEPYTSKVLVRFRIDGVLHDIVEMPKRTSDLILTRIKVLSAMRTDEHRAAQDGKFRFYIDANIVTTEKDRFIYDNEQGELVDVRVSIVPVTEGENIVMRILASKSRQFNISTLGFSESDGKKIEKAIKHPHGMILVTGPTGSGKTTTLYAILKILNKREVHISTIEDPVEYDIQGISQIQVNPQTNLTFAKGLRAIVRQDPDIIMVGEIRDEETAGIAVNSALTGHLVLSTLHTNDAATTLPRLLDMQVKPFLVASTVNIAIAQRLVRKICQKCRVSHNFTDQELVTIRDDETIRPMFEKRYGNNLKKAIVFKGSGCKICNGTGYTGRVGIFEILEMTDKIRKLVVEKAPSTKITAAAMEEGMTTMLQDGIQKVFNGVTTLDEVLRAVRMNGD